MFYSIIRDFSEIVADYSVTTFQRLGNAYSLVAKVELKDNSVLYVKDYLFPDNKRKYSFHWQQADGTLIVRWDNSPHHQVSSFPHHKHLPNSIEVSNERTLRDIMEVIKKLI